MRIASLLLFAAAAFAADEPQPREVKPGAAPGAPPSDAIVLFDGSSAAAWAHADGRSAQWPIENGAIVCRSGSGDLYTRRKFGSAQIHIEFSTPDMPQAAGQAKGNSGVYLQGRYEIQILDSYHNPTYPNGSAAALYGQHAPLVNASLPPGEWQSFDIVFHAPRCRDGRVLAPATVTLFHNGVLVQDHAAVKAPTGGGDATDACAPGPLRLQDHFHPDVKETFLRFRNLWLRPLEE
jgi:hypothetical protein